MDGTIENAVINEPPGSSKTEMFVVNFIARGLVKNPRARFLHLSASSELALLNSQSARDIVTSEEYQKFWPYKISDDANAKARWNIMLDGKPAGGVYATSSAGQVTGFRAGHMAPGWQGAIVIDDPMKPEDAFSAPKVKAINRRLLTTIKSRKANPKTPIVVVMQRVGENDPTQFIKDGNMPGKWTYITIPALIDDDYINALPDKYRALIEITERDQHGRQSYWQYKEPLDELLKMERGEGANSDGARMSRHVFAGQYMQNPTAQGGNIIKGEDFVYYTVLPKIRWRTMYADTAQKTKEHNDYSVFQVWGYGEDGRIYLLDMIRFKAESPELKKRAIAFWHKHVQNAQSDLTKIGQLRKLKVEDKSSGTDLIQSLRLPPPDGANIPIYGIERSVDKLTRVNDALPYIESHQVCIPIDAPFTHDFVAECEGFTADDTHAFDDQVDAMVDAIIDMLSTGSNKLKIWAQLGRGAK